MSDCLKKCPKCGGMYFNITESGELVCASKNNFSDDIGCGYESKKSKNEVDKAMSDNDCDYVKDMRARFEENKNQSHALMIEVLADNKRFIEYLNYLGICPHDGSPTAEDIVGMRIQALQRTIDRYEQALRDIEGSAFDCGKNYQTAKEAATWMNGRASEALSDLS